MKTLGLWLLRAFVVLLILILLAVAAVYAARTWLLPDLTVLQPRIEAKLSQTLKQPVRVQGLSAAWNWHTLDIKLAQLAIGPVDAPVLQARGIDTTLAAYPLLSGTVDTQHLNIAQLSLVANQSGSAAAPKWLVAGVDASAPSDGAALRWAMTQPSLKVAALEINAKDAAAHWIPETTLKAALEGVSLINSGREHTLALAFAPNYTDARLGKGVALNSTFSHALLGDMTQPANWTGQATITVPQAHIARSTAWLLPLLASKDAAASAQASGWLRWAKQSLSQATLASQTTLNFAPDALAAKGKASVQGLAAQNEAVFAPFDWTWAHKPKQGTHAVQASSAKLALSPLAALVETMPLPTAYSRALSQAQARGALSDLKLMATLDKDGVQSANFSAQATQLGLQQFDWAGDKGLVNIPTISGVTGALTISHSPTQTDTHIALNSSQAYADLPRLFDKPRIDFDTLTGDVDVKLTPQQVALTFNKVRFNNTDLDGEINGQYTVATKRSADDKTLGLAQLSGTFARADMAQLHRYMPLSLTANARDWLRHTISQGQARELQFTLNGELSRFPFLAEVAQAGERFDLQAKINRAVLNFNPLAKTDTPAPSKAGPWPLINEVSGELKLHGLSLSLQNMEGIMQPVGTDADAAPMPIRVPKLEIASLTQPVVAFQTRATAPAAQVLSLVRNTPLSQSFADQLAVLKVSGTVDVDAQLSLDIGKPESNLAQGTFKLDNGSLQISADLPPLEQMNATLAFKQTSLRVEQASAKWLGGTLTASGGFDTQDPKQTLKTQGTAQLAVVKQLLPQPMARELLKHAVGSVDYVISLNAKPEGFTWQLTGDLNDTILQWAGILDKPSGVSLPFSLTRTPTLRTVNRANQQTTISQDTWEATLGATVLGSFKGIVERQLVDGQWRIKNAAVALGAQAELNAPEQGLGVHIVTSKVNLDSLRKEIEALPWASLPPLKSSDAAKDAATSTDAAAGMPPAWMPSVIALQVGDLTVGNRRFYDVVGAAVRSGERGQRWDVNVVAKGINGYLNWVDDTRVAGFGDGQIIAKLTELTIPDSEVQSTSKALLNISPKQVPSIDLSIDRLTVGDRALGAVSFKASNLALRDESLGWRIDSLSMVQAHANIKGSGLWTQSPSTPQGEVKLNLALSTDSLGLTLEALGLGKQLDGAAGTVTGDVAWQGTPFNLDLSSLSGALQADFSKGQFLKIDPGAGRLVGLFSLQNLPRRLTLDFKDMFGTGFAFNNMKASGKIEQGVLKTDDFLMNSALAEVTAQGEVSLVQETQALRFNVKPNFDAGSVSLLYMLINPPIGLATLAAQYLFREPIRRSLSVEYAITGAWDKPDVKQVKREIK